MPKDALLKHTKLNQLSRIFVTTGLAGYFRAPDFLSSVEECHTSTRYLHEENICSDYKDLIDKQ